MPETETTVRTWRHSRKGLVRGVVIRDDDADFVAIRLVGNHELRYNSEQNRGRIDEDGEILTLRRSLMIEMSDS